MKNIAIENVKGFNFLMTDKSEMRETRYIPIEFFPVSNVEINIYDSYLHCMVINEQGHTFAFILNELNLIILLKSVHNFLWNSLDLK